MEVEEYQGAIRAAALCASLLRQWDIPDLLRKIERADAMGPILDPTLWRDKHAAMEEDREILRAALPLWKIGGKLQERVAE